MDDQPVKIDESLARGLFRQEIREKGGDVLRQFYDGKIHEDIGDLGRVVSTELYGRATGKKQFPIASFTPVARTVRNHKLGPCEALYQVEAKVVNASSHKSFLEMAYRKR